MTIFLIGLVMLCMVAFTDAIGDSDFANHADKFWRWFYASEQKLFQTSYIVMLIGIVAHVLSLLINFLH